MKIKQLNTIGMGLRELGELPIKGRLKFKVARNIKVAEDILADAASSIKTEEDSIDVMNTDVDVEFLSFTEEELEPFELNSKTVYMLLDIIEPSTGNAEGAL